MSRVLLVCPASMMSEYHRSPLLPIHPILPIRPIFNSNILPSTPLLCGFYVPSLKPPLPTQNQYFSSFVSKLLKIKYIIRRDHQNLHHPLPVHFGGILAAVIPIHPIPPISPIRPIVPYAAIIIAAKNRVVRCPGHQPHQKISAHHIDNHLIPKNLKKNITIHVVIRLPTASNMS